MTSVSSSMPRCFRSWIRAGGGLVDVAGQRPGASRVRSAVVIPAAVVELDEADIALGQPPGQQAVGGEGSRLADVVAIELVDVLRLLRCVHQLRDARLHPERHLVLRDARLDLRIADAVVQLAGSDAARPSSWLRRCSARDARRVGKIKHRIARAAELHALIPAGQKARAP